jgi:hypothetical protein
LISAAVFRSVLFADGHEPAGAAEPPFFRDLNLDQVVEAMVVGRDEYELRPFFWAPLRDVEAVEYRHEHPATRVRRWVYLRLRRWRPPIERLGEGAARGAARERSLSGRISS